MRVGITGIGRMGAAIGERLLQHGHDLSVWNRSASKLEPLRRAGARVAATPAALAAGSDVVMSLLTDAAAIDAVYRGAEGLLAADVRGKVFLEMSTVRPAVHLALAQEASRRGAAYLDCPVGGTVTPARAGQLLALVGGAAADLERVRPLLAQLTRRIEHLGPVGSGARVKLAMNLMMQVCWQSFGEAMALCSPLGLAPERLVEVFSSASGVPPGLAHRLPSIAQALHGAGIAPVNFDVDAVRKDMRTMVEEARALGLSIPVAERALECFDAVSAAGRGGEDCAMLSVRWMLDALGRQQTGGPPGESVPGVKENR